MIRTLVALAVLAAPPSKAKPEPVDEKGIFLHDGVALAIVVSHADVSRLAPTGPFTAEAEGVRILSGGNLYDAGSRKPVLAAGEPRIDDFAELPGGIVAIAGTSLGFVTGGRFTAAVLLPESRMRVFPASRDSVWVHGGADIYRFSAGGKYERVLHVPRGPLTSLAVANDSLFFAAGSEILLWSAGREPGRVFRMPDGVRIDGMGYDPDSKILYFTAAGALWALHRGEAVMVASISGEVRMFDGVPVVLDRNLGLVAGVVGVPNALARKEKAP